MQTFILLSRRVGAKLHNSSVPLEKYAIKEVHYLTWVALVQYMRYSRLAASQVNGSQQLTIMIEVAFRDQKKYIELLAPTYCLLKVSFFDEVSP